MTKDQTEQAVSDPLHVAHLMANALFNFAQKCGETLSSDDCAMFDKLRKQFDAAFSQVRGKAQEPVCEVGFFRTIHRWFKDVPGGTILYAAAPQPDAQQSEKGAVSEIAAERERQKAVEGWTPEHDDEHADRSLAQAARCYVEHYVGRAWLLDDQDHGAARYANDEMPYEWPDSWAEHWWKPKNPRRDLIRAAALIAAEIDRIDRAALAKEQE
ncbi:MAG TPA: hypothetical protein VJ654_00655 [Noviherbaspirillum sp.]|nr:hypothetical protein [Noviherbaspirillum sp.]